MKRMITIALLVLTIAACSGPDQEEIDPLQAQRQALEKARAVEGVVQDSAERQRRLIDEQ